MIKLIKFSPLLLPILLSAKIINGVSLTVDDEPITLFEIYKESTEKKIPYDEAIENLIEKEVKRLEVKNEALSIDDYELNSELESIASKNGATLSQFKAFLESKGIEFAEYKERLRDKLLADKLNKKIAYKKFKEIDEREVKAYYETNKKDFVIAKSFDVIKYEADSKEALESKIANPMANTPNIKKEEITLKADTIDPRLSLVLNETSEGKFTPLLSTEKNFVSFYVVKKGDVQTLTFEDVKDGIFSKIASEKEGKFVKEYLEKAKANARINIIRLPN